MEIVPFSANTSLEIKFTPMNITFHLVSCSREMKQLKVVQVNGSRCSRMDQVKFVEDSL